MTNVGNTFSGMSSSSDVHGRLNVNLKQIKLRYKLNSALHQEKREALYLEKLPAMAFYHVLFTDLSKFDCEEEWSIFLSWMSEDSKRNLLQYQLAER